MPPRRYRPFSSVTIVLTTPVSAFVTVIVTPGRTPLCASITIPVMTAFETCPQAGMVTVNARQTAREATRIDERLNVGNIICATFKKLLIGICAHYTAKRELWTER